MKILLLVFALMFLVGSYNCFSREISLVEEIAAIRSKDGNFLMSLQLQAGALNDPQIGQATKIIQPTIYLVVKSTKHQTRWDFPVGFSRSAGNLMIVRIEEVVRVTIIGDNVEISLDEEKFEVSKLDYEKLCDSLETGLKLPESIREEWSALVKDWSSVLDR